MASLERVVIGCSPYFEYALPATKATQQIRWLKYKEIVIPNGEF